MVPSDANPRRDRGEWLIGSPMVDGLAAIVARSFHTLRVAAGSAMNPRWSCRRSRSLNGKTPRSTCSLGPTISSINRYFLPP